MQHEPKLYKNANGYTWDSGHVFTWLMHYNADGTYKGQTQMDVQGDGDLYFSAEIIDGVPCVDGKPARSLTPEEMANAA